MDPRLLQAYNDELVHLRETAKRFGEDYPSVAGRLGLGAAAQVDPHVERLLEGVAFLGARVQLKLQDQFPDFTQHLLSAIQPHYLAPTPSICIVGFEPHEGDAALAQGIEIERGTRLQAIAADRDATPVTFQTGHAVTLWPLRVEAVEYLPSRSAVAPYLASLQPDAAVEAGLRIRLRTTGAPGWARSRSLPCRSISMARGRWLENSIASLLPMRWRWWPQRHRAAAACLCPCRCRMVSAKIALLPAERRSNRGYRILSEYFACPQRFQFVRLEGLDKACKALAEAEACDIVILFRRKAETLEGAVSAVNLRAFATPAINLYEKQLDRVQITAFDHERLVVADRARPLDFEIYRLLDVHAHGRQGSEPREVAPIYDYSGQLYDWNEALFYVTRLRHRRLSTREQRMRRRGDYTGSETWISLTAPGRPTGSMTSANCRFARWSPTASWQARSA
jgi:type VI secretion system protein ImpG